MDSWLKKLKNNGNKRTADDVEEAVKANANRVLAICVCVLFLRVRLCGLPVPVLCYCLLPFNTCHKYTMRSAYYFNREGSRNFFEVQRESRAKKFGKPLYGRSQNKSASSASLRLSLCFRKNLKTTA